MPGTPRSSTLPRSSNRARADDQITHGAGDENFPRAGPTADPCRDVNCDPANVVVAQFAFAGVNAGADLDAQGLDVSAQGLGAADRLRRAVERDQVAVAVSPPPCRRIVA